jgi:hypothetical protein
MRKLLIACALFGLTCPGVWSGVVMEMEENDPGAPAGAPIDTIYAQGEMLRMDSRAEGSGRMSIIFRDETLWMVSHEEKSCQTIDKEAMEQLSAQLGGVMKQMEAELAKLPPEQRAMMEKMMKSRMPAGMSGGGTAGPPRRIEVGAVDKVGEYSCTLHTLFAGDDKVWEICAAAEKALPGAASEALGAFRAMSRFADQLRETLQQGPLADMISTPFHEMNEVNGFPVRVRSFERGRVTNETTLKSIVNKDLEAAVFDVPDGYKVKNLADEMNQGR